MVVRPCHPSYLPPARKTYSLTFFLPSEEERNDTFHRGAIVGTTKTHTYFWPDISQLKKLFKKYGSEIDIYVAFLININKIYIFLPLVI